MGWIQLSSSGPKNLPLFEKKNEKKNWEEFMCFWIFEPRHGGIGSDDVPFKIGWCLGSIPAVNFQGCKPNTNKNQGCKPNAKNRINRYIPETDQFKRRSVSSNQHVSVVMLGFRGKYMQVFQRKETAKQPNFATHNPLQPRSLHHQFGRQNGIDCLNHMLYMPTTVATRDNRRAIPATLQHLFFAQGFASVLWKSLQSEKMFGSSKKNLLSPPPCRSKR